MRKFLLFSTMFLLLFAKSIAQVIISNDNSAPDPSAGLDVRFNNKGFLPPTMTFEQRNAIPNPAEGLMVYCTNCTPEGAGTITIFKGGQWIILSVGTCDVPNAPVSGMHVPSVTEITWKWNKTPIAAGYKWNTTNNYATAIDIGVDTSRTETNLTCWTNYDRYVWAYNVCGNSTSPVTLTQTTSPNIFSPAPTEGTNISTLTSIVWNWNPVAGATGYKWGVTNDISTATDMALATTKTETDLTNSTSYTRYVWAYDGCGYSISVALTQTTLVSIICGSSITINHVAGIVAPVTKTVTYDIVTGLPGLNSVCWITRNLGASQQATAVNDASEASAGWYWQFNRKQGYQYTTTRTPATTWINSIPESSDWISANDPCTLELGAGWRIPTAYEWFNVNTSGSWTNWNGPYTSALRMHAAGYLSYGSIVSRGSQGWYWSSANIDNTYGYAMLLNTSYSGTTYFSKANGQTLRCLRDY